MIQKTCEGPGQMPGEPCAEPHYALECCEGHYQQKRRNKPLTRLRQRRKKGEAKAPRRSVNARVPPVVAGKVAKHGKAMNPAAPDGLHAGARAIYEAFWKRELVRQRGITPKTLDLSGLPIPSSAAVEVPTYEAVQMYGGGAKVLTDWARGVLAPRKRSAA